MPSVFEAFMVPIRFIFLEPAAIIFFKDVTPFVRSNVPIVVAGESIFVVSPMTTSSTIKPPPSDIASVYKPFSTTFLTLFGKLKAAEDVDAG